MPPSPPLRERLRAVSNRPLVAGPAPADLFPDGPDGIVHALRRAAQDIVAAQREIVEAGADLVIAPTAQTTAPALHQSGQAYRAAALTAAAVDLTRDAVFASRASTSVIGEVEAAAGARARAESRVHVERLATSAIDGILVRVYDVEAATDIIRRASAHGLPTLVEVPTDLVDVIAQELAAAAHAVLLIRGSDIAQIAAALERAHDKVPAVLLGARVEVDGDGGSAQLAAATAWGTFSSMGLSVMGLCGRGSLAGLRALGDLATAERPSLEPAVPTIRDR
jgi:hypothetical protein